MNTLLKEKLKKSGYRGKFNLSSLIEACGDKFWQLCIRPSPKDWCASTLNCKIQGLGLISGEAVANLWLKLNEN